MSSTDEGTRRVKPRLEVTDVREQLRFSNRWLLGEVLGKGTFGHVHVATSIADPRDVRACKVISKSDEEGEAASVEGGGAGARRVISFKTLWREVEILRKLKHPNVVELHDSFDEDNKLLIVMERVCGGDLFERIVQRTHHTESDARDLLLTTLSGLKHCHDHGVVHRDIKPENLLLADEEGNNIKLADFGNSSVVFTGDACEDVDRQLFGLVGSEGYIAPEVLKGEAYGRPCDLWSLGVVAYILLGGYPPWNLEKETRELQIAGSYYPMMDAEGQEPVWSNVSEDAQDFVRRLLVVEPSDRMTVDEALAHAWIVTSTDTLAGRSLAASLARFKKLKLTGLWRGAFKGIIATRGFSTVTKTAASE